jgi:hypothetical protein
MTNQSSDDRFVVSNLHAQQDRNLQILLSFLAQIVKRRSPDRPTAPTFEEFKEALLQAYLNDPAYPQAAPPGELPPASQIEERHRLLYDTFLQTIGNNNEQQH